MQWLAARLGESRIVRAVLAAVVLGGLLIVALLREPHRMIIVSAAERARSVQLFDGWLAASRAERCERPVLREPASGDGRGDYGGIAGGRFSDPTSPLAACRDALWKIHDELDMPSKRKACPQTPLAQQRLHPEVLERCAGLLATIERHAHTTASCSPIAPEYAMFEDLPPVSPFYVARLVRLQAAQRVAQGHLADAARDVTNAMRFVTDYGRNGALTSVIIGQGAAGHLGCTLDEVLSDPRMRADEARAIVRDLDVVFASPEPFDRVMRAEILAMTTYFDLDPMRHGEITHDRAQDRALMILAHERWLSLYERLCKDVTLAICATKLRCVHAVAPVDVAGDFEPILTSTWNPELVRERILDELVGTRALFDVYAQKMAEGEAHFARVRAKAAARAAQP